MFSSLRPTYKAILLTLLAYAGFSVSDTALKFITPYYSPYQLIATDLFLAALIFLGLAPKMGGLKALHDPRNMKLHILRGVLNFIGSIAVVSALGVMDLASFYIIAFMQPFIMTIIAIPLYKEKVGWHRWAAIFTGFLGIIVAFRPWQSGFDSSMLIYLAILPTAFAVLHIVMRSMKDARYYPSGFYPVLFGSLLTMPFLFFEGNFTPFALSHIPYIVISAICIVIGFLSASRAFHMADSSLVGPIQYSQLIWGVVLGYLIFGDVPSLWVAAGAIIIIGSGIYLIQREHKANPDTDHTPL